MPDWPAFTPDANQKPYQNMISVKVRWQYRTGRRSARRRRPLMPAQEKLFQKILSSGELLVKCLAIMGGRI
jgi:hypothetical protein